MVLAASCYAIPALRQSKAVYTRHFSYICMKQSLIFSALGHGMLTTVAYQLSRNGKKEDVVYALEGSVAYAGMPYCSASLFISFYAPLGSLIQWLRDNLQVVSCAKEAEKLALTVPDSGGVFFVPAFSGQAMIIFMCLSPVIHDTYLYLLGLFAPYWRSDARGVIVGMTAFNTKAHVVIIHKVNVLPGCNFKSNSHFLRSGQLSNRPPFRLTKSWRQCHLIAHPMDLTERSMLSHLCAWMEA